MNRSFRILGRLAVVIAVASCTKHPVPTSTTHDHADATGESHSEASHEHHHHGGGPHGGAIVDWGGGIYHVEFTVDHPKKRVAVYVLGSDAKTPTPIKARSVLLSINEPLFQIELTPQPLEGETDGASRFIGQHEHFGKVQEFAGTISALVGDTPYAADFAEEAEGHDHKH